MVLSKMTEDQAFRKAFGPEEARSFAMGIPLLSKNYDIPNMKVTEETRPLIDVVYDEMSNQAVAEADALAEDQKEFTLGIIANEGISDRMFLFEDENDRFYLNLEFKTMYRPWIRHQVQMQTNSIYTWQLDEMIGEKAHSRGTKKKLSLFTKDDKVAPVYSFIVCTAYTGTSDDTWLDKTQIEKMYERDYPMPYYLGIVNCHILSDEALLRFGPSVRIVFMFARVKCERDKVNLIYSQNWREFQKLDNDMRRIIEVMVGEFLGLLAPKPKKARRNNNA